MKFCPTCETYYDEEILRFCTKDGTPLIDENQPSFTELPSNADEADLGEETVVSYKPPKDLLPPEQPVEVHRSEAPRIVISTTEKNAEQNVRPRVIPPYQGVPQKSNTAKVVILTILGTVAVLAMGLGLFAFLRDDQTAGNSNINVNTNPPDVNLNTNLNIGATNFNISPVSNMNTTSNYNFNVSTNFNTNTNTKSPTPTPKPSPSPSPTPSANTNVGNTITNTAPPSPKPSPSLTPRPATPTPNSTPRSTPNNVPGGRPPANGNR